MQTIVLDFESYFDTKSGFSLKKLTTEEYVRSPLFKAHGVGVRHPDGQYHWVAHTHLPYYFSRIDWSDTAVIVQHGQFDGLVLSHHYGVYPSMFLDTLSMANLVLQNHAKSLDAMAAYFDLPRKHVPYDLFDGVRDLPPHVEREVADGCLHDCRLTWEVFQRFIQGVPELRVPVFPRGDLEVIDATIKMFTTPSLEIDIPRALALSERIIKRKEVILARVYEWLSRENPALVLAPAKADDTPVDLMRKTLRSRERFADILREFEIEPPTKPKRKKADGTGGEGVTYAFAKNDIGMQEILDSENEWVVTIAEAKLEVASTINETRSARLAYTAQRGQPIPVYEKYSSTFSLRHTGGDKLNWTNLERLPNFIKELGHYELAEDGHIKKGEIRLCIKAPKGKKLVIADLSQIECRTLALHAGQWDLLDDFRKKLDVYSRFIEPYYGYPISKDTPSERGVGKALILSAGYQSGAKTIKRTAALGTYGPPLYLTDAESEALKVYYRQKNNAIAGRGGHWAKAKAVIDILAFGRDYDWEPVRVHDRRIWLPNGCFLDYSQMEQMPLEEGQRERQWAVKTRRGLTRLYGGKVTAHVNSALARIVMTEAMRAIARDKDFQRWAHIALTVYDEIVAVADEAYAEECKALMEREMGRTPWWAPSLPVAVEAHISDIYDK